MCQHFGGIFKMKTRVSMGNKAGLFSSALVVIVAIAYKFSLTATSLLPGLDGAYYWVQVRSLLENASLAFSDLPFVMWVQAAIAYFLNDIPSAVRISDALLPALSAIPVYLMARRYSMTILPTLSIAFVLFHPVQLYFFTGDFIKNEAAIPAVFFLSWVFLCWDELSKKYRYLNSLIAMSVIALSHFGTLLLAVMMTTFWLIMQIRQKRSEISRKTIALTLLALMFITLILVLLIPSRFETLTKFVLNPGDVFQVPAWYAITNGFANPVIAATIILSQVGCLLLIFLALRIRKSFSVNELSLVTSSLVTTLLLSSPFIGIEWFNRLAALSFVPLTVAGIIVVGKVHSRLPQVLIGALAGLTLLTSLFLSSRGPTPPVLTESQHEDFQEFVQAVQLPDNSVVVARHGMQFLTAWYLKVDVASETFFEESDLSDYSAVYLLIEESAGDTSGKSNSLDADNLNDKLGAESKTSDSSTKEDDKQDDGSLNPEKGGSPEIPEGASVISSNGYVLVQIR
jgi:hypothetical protein